MMFVKTDFPKDAGMGALPGRAFSLAQLTGIGIAAAAGILLIAAALIDVLNGQTAQRLFQQESQTLAARFAYGLAGRLQDSVVAVEGEARDARVAAALHAADPGGLAAVEAQLLKQLSGALRVRLLPLGATKGLEGGAFPQLSFADLEMLRYGEAKGVPPPLEAHFFGMEIAHIDIVRPVRDANGALAGQVLASFGGDFVQGVVDHMEGPLGYLEVRQPGDDQNRRVVLARRGEAALAQRGDPIMTPIIGTRWQLLFWPSAAAQGSVLWHETLVWGVFAAVLLALAAIFYLLYRTLQKGYQADLAAIIELVRDIQTGGRLTMNDRQPQIRDAEGTFEVLEAMAHGSGAADSPRPMLQKGPADKPTSPVGAEKVPASIFRAYDIRGVVGRTLTEQIVYDIGRALGSEAFARGQQTIIVARDGRLSGPDFSRALSKGLCDTGRDVIDIGQVPTPVLYFATHYLNTGSGVMVTGSHNPADYNGLKMVLKAETLAEEDIQLLRRRIEGGDFTAGAGNIQHQDVIADYIATIVADVQLARPLKVVIDCGNGVAGGVAPALLRTLGCEVIELYCDVDGHFPNHHPDPSQLENLEDLIGAVKGNKADLGLAFDGDGDRLALVDGDGKVIWPDRQMMLYAADVLSRNPGACILFDIKCSRHLAKVISKHGGRPLMWKTGHSLIKRKMKETGALLAGEMSGHIFFKERWYGFDDALYTAARLLEILSSDPRPVAAVFQALPDAVSTPELRVDLAEGQQIAFMNRLLSQAKLKGAALTTIDGLRADFEDGWGLVRASNTTPSLILRFEANSEVALRRIKDDFRTLMHRVDPKLALPF